RGESGEIRSRGEQRGPRREAAEEQVGGDVGLPRRGLDDGLAVIGLELRLRHHELLAPSAATPTGARALPGARRHGLSGQAGAGSTRVVGRRLVGLVGVGHQDRPPAAKATTAPPSSVAAASAACRHIAGAWRVVTTGSGGRPYTSGSSRSRKNAPVPPTPLRAS